METNYFESLKEKYGNHTAAAEALGVSQRTYRAWRKRLPKHLSRFIQMGLRAALDGYAAEPTNRMD